MLFSQLRIELASPVSSGKPTGAQGVIERSPSEWTSRPGRKATSTTGIIYRDDGSWMRVQMIDLSYDGCHLLTEERLNVGETLKLVIPSMQHLTAQVRWVKENEAGVRLLHNASAAEVSRARLGF